MRVNVAYDSPSVRASVNEVYCGHCHLATPSWREKCIHCFKPLPALAGSDKIAATDKRESHAAIFIRSELQIRNPSSLRAAISSTHGAGEAKVRIF